jgi:hypothetical protein
MTVRGGPESLGECMSGGSRQGSKEKRNEGKGPMCGLTRKRSMIGSLKKLAPFCTERRKLSVLLANRRSLTPPTAALIFHPSFTHFSQM